MAAVLTAGQLTTLQALPNLEQQTAFICGVLSDKEQAYNTANPNNTFDNVVFDPSPNTKTLTITLNLPTIDQAALVPAHESVSAYLA